MVRLRRCVRLIVLAAALAGCRPATPRVLVFSRTAAFRHSSIPAGKAALQKLGAAQGFVVDTTEDPRFIMEDSLRHYAAVVFLSTTGEVLDRAGQLDLERYIQAGGGFVGIHAASDALYDWRWYGRLVGGYFNGHPAIQPARLVVADTTSPMTKHLPKVWERTDEWYNFKRLTSDLTVLLSIDETSYHGGTNGAGHPMTWYHAFEGGRAWYTELGHTDESFAEASYLTLVAEGIKYAIGDGKALDYGKATARRMPDLTGLTKTVLTKGTLTEPTEIAVLPNLDVLIIQRRGEVYRYGKADGTVKQVGKLDVYWKTSVKGVNAEEGLLGLVADPDYATNHFIYLFYSPVTTSVNRLSRFTFAGDSLDLRSERVILEFYSQRNICCHTGGSLAFGPNRTLVISTGDNSTPFDEPGQRYPSHGFSPRDDRPGHEQYDARRSSSNTNDLRGKVLRVLLDTNGSYQIPADNLFPKGTPNTRPEIYAMGTRNAYRVSVDPKTGTVYWGDVGPDAEFDSLATRGPMGYDEINQARKAGYFGWPLFIGDNYPYRAYDYATGKTGPFFDPAHPRNESRNNTGLKDLPPAQPAFIWYPYHDSPDFPSVKTGGRTALAGPIYYADRFRGQVGALPAYYDGKLIIYDWIRGWMKAVTMTPAGDFEALEPFMEGTKFAAPIDVELGPDGALYVLEYGTGWFAKNPDMALSRIALSSK